MAKSIKEVIYTELTSDELLSTSIVDGQFIFVTDTGNIYLDTNSVRIPMGGVDSDKVLSVTSTNPIENQAITNAIIDDLNIIKAITVSHIPVGALALKQLEERVSALEGK